MVEDVTTISITTKAETEVATEEVVEVVHVMGVVQDILHSETEVAVEEVEVGDAEVVIDDLQDNFGRDWKVNQNQKQQK